MKKTAAILLALFNLHVYAGPVANVDFVHKQIKNVWGLDVPFSKHLQDVSVIANMEYLLAAVDRTNFLMNGRETSWYHQDAEFATKQAIDVDATVKAVNTLVKPQVLVLRTVPNTATVSVQLAVAGDFRIAWGDGIVQDVTSDSAQPVTYTHTYQIPGVYYIAPFGTPTAYNQDDNVPTFKIVEPEKLARIYGTLGSVFPTLEDGSQPSFNGFCVNKTSGQGCVNLGGSIPENMFEGIYGAPRANMFKELFTGAANLEGNIPENLFANIVGPTQAGIFEQTFNGCKKLTGSLSAKFFAGIKGEVKERLFKETFRNCDGLTGGIPADLFAGITGAPKYQCFRGTFEYCDNISGQIPESLFAGIKGAPAVDMFANTFKYCPKLTGNVPAGLFAGIKGPPAIGMFYATFQYTRKMSGQIPQSLFAGISGAPAVNMFADTFSQTGLGGALTGDLFAGIRGAPAEGMFMGTFYDSGVSSVSADLFAGIRGAPRANMFNRTFHWSNIQSVPGGLFSGLSGATEYTVDVQNSNGEWTEEKRTIKGAFAGTFSDSVLATIPEDLMGDTVFTGDSSTINGVFSNMFARTNRGSKMSGPSLKMFYELPDGSVSTERKPIYEIWTPTSDQNTYNGATGLEDYSEIPDLWK